MYYDYYLYYLSYLSSLYNGYPLVVRITVVMIMVFALVVLFGIFRLFFTGYKLNKAANRKDKMEQEYQDKLAFIMRSDINYDVEELEELLEFDQKKSKSWRLDIFTDLVLDVRDTLAEKQVLNHLNYKNCLEALKLMPFWEKRLRTSEIVVRKNALQTIGLLNNGMNTGLISKSVYHKNKHLRKAARNVHTDLDSYNPFRFMEENFDESFTQLDKIRLHATLVKRYNEGKLPNLLRWLNNSKNSNYISFIIQEVGFFEQFDASPTLLDMLDKQEHRDVRMQIIRTLGNLGYTESVTNLTKRYALESSPIREVILKTLGVMRGDESLQFLLDTYPHTHDDHMKITIVRSIRKHGRIGEESLHVLQKEAKDQEKVIIHQVFAEQHIIKA
jgi:hypothetical protein